MRRGVLIGVLLLALASLAQGEQSRTYSSFWGPLFQSTSHRTPNASSLVQGFRQRLALANASDPPSLLALFPTPTSSSPTAGEHRGLNYLLEAQLNFTTALLGHHSWDWGAGAAAGSGDSGADSSGADSNNGSSWGQGLLHKLQQHLDTDWSKADPHQLAAIALLQGWALTSLLSAGAKASSPSPAARGGSRSSGLPSSLGSDKAAAVSSPQWTSFHGQLCLRLQNFGSREGYAAALLGPDPCSAASSAVAEELAWGPAAAFTLDCAPPASGDAAGGDGATATAPAAGAAGGLAQQQQQSPPPQGAPSTAYTWGREVPPAGAAPASQRSSHCQLSVASSSGRGALLQQAFQRPLLGPPINALSVRLCNIAPSTLQHPAAVSGSSSSGSSSSGSSITLEGVKLNGRPLLPASGLTATHASSTGGCQQQLFRLPSRAAGKGFVLSGHCMLEEGGDGSNSPGFGVGQMASVELVLGEYNMLDAAASKLLGGGADAGGGTPPT